MIALAARPAAAQTLRWHVQESSNFRIYSYSAAPLDEKIRAECERLRSEVYTAWLPAADQKPWRPKCHLVLHGTAASYQAAYSSAGAEATAGKRTTGQRTAGKRAAANRAAANRAAVGSAPIHSVGQCVVQIREGEVTYRRIDLCIDPQADKPYRLANLPHEISHILASELSPNVELPRWIDEGMALMADTPAKQTAHLQDLHRALHQRQAPRIGEIISAKQYPRDQQLNAFYGQSLSLVELLVARQGRQRFVDFVKATAENGLEPALGSVYELEDVSALESLWVDRVALVGNGMP